MKSVVNPLDSPLMTLKPLLAFLLATICAATIAAQLSSGPAKGTLILTGGDQETGIKEFVALAGGPDANIVYIPTAASSLRLPSGLIWEWLYTDELPANTPEFKQELCKMFGVKNITILHTRNQKTADSKEFVEPLRKAQGVWLSGGNPAVSRRLILGLARNGRSKLCSSVAVLSAAIRQGPSFRALTSSEAIPISRC